MTAPFDIDAVRAQFPILSRKVNGQPLRYLDSAASSQKPEPVIEAMAHAMRHSYANVHRGLHTLANETTAAYEAARESARRFINAAHVEEIVFTKGATHALNIIASGLGARLQPGDEVLLSVMEHHSNIVPWHFLRERCGVELRWIELAADGALDMDSFERQLGPRTKVVSLTHMSNVLGSTPDIARISRMAHAAGAVMVVDGCQSAVHLDVDVQALGADFFVFSGHKVCGPTGIGVLYGRLDLLRELPPLEGGGEMIEVVTRDRVTYNAPPHRFEAGTPAILEAIGLGAALDWLMALDRQGAHAHKQELLAAATEAVRGVNGLTIHGQAPGKGPVLTFSLAGAHPHDIAQILDQFGVAIRAGHHCAQPLMTHLGVTATARASFALYNTMDDAEAFASALRKARAMLV